MIAEPVALEVHPATDPAWEAFARSHGSLFNSPPWIRALVDAFDLDVRGVMTHRSAGRQALAWAELDDPSGQRRSTLPFCDYFDPMAEGVGFDWGSLGAEPIDSDIGFSIRLRERPELVLPEGLRPASRFGWHSVNLGPSLDQIWSALPGNARQGVRRARRLGAVAAVETDWAAIDEFRRLHVALRREKYGMLAQPPEFFEALSTHFGAADSLGVISARIDGRMVAGVLLLRWGSTAYYKLNASTADGTAVHANDLCMWTSIVHAKERWESQALDLGLSDLDQPGLLRYKMKYASDSGYLVTWSNAASSRLPHQRRFRKVLDDVVATVLADGVPEEVGVRVAANIYRYFC